MSSVLISSLLQQNNYFSYFLACVFQMAAFSFEILQFLKQRKEFSLCISVRTMIKKTIKLLLIKYRVKKTSCNTGFPDLQSFSSLLSLSRSHVLTFLCFDFITALSICFSANFCLPSLQISMFIDLTLFLCDDHCTQNYSHTSDEINCPRMTKTAMQFFFFFFKHIAIFNRGSNKVILKTIP